MRVPFVDLKAQYLNLRGELDAAIRQVTESAEFIGGAFATRLERSFAEYLGAEHCLGVANGTDALEIALKAIGIESGMEVIVPANTFIATAEAVSNVEAKPVFADCDATTYNLAATDVEKRISDRTRAIIAVHLYGLPAEMDDLLSIAQKHDLQIIEDTAQAHGAVYKGRMAGTFGTVSTFSFYPSKNLGAFGDAGAIVTDNAEVAERARLIANHGQSGKNRHSMIGRNSRMDGMQAAVLSAKLPHLDGWIEARRSRARLYDELLKDSGAVIPTAPEYAKHAYHLYVVRVPDRDKVRARLDSAGIQTAVHYPVSLPLTGAYEHSGYEPEDHPVANSQMGELLSLPMYAELTDEMVRYVCSELRAAVAIRTGA